MVHPDLDQILNSLIEFAKTCLEKYGEFYPFGMSKKVGGGQRAESGWTGNNMPPSQELIDLLTKGYQQDAKEKKIIAAGICSDITVTESNGNKTEAMRCDLEHIQGDSVSIYLPYKKVGSVFEYGEIWAEKKDKKFFVT